MKQKDGVKKSIIRKLVLVVGATILAVLIVSLFVEFFRVRDSLKKDYFERGELITASIAASLFNYSAELDGKEDEWVDYVLSENIKGEDMLGVFVYSIPDDGGDAVYKAGITIAVDSKEQEDALEKYMQYYMLPKETIEEMIPNNEICEESEESELGQLFEFIKRINNTDRTLKDFVVVSLFTDELNSAIFEEFLTRTIFELVSFSIISIVLIIFFRKKISEPLKKLGQNMKSFVEDDKIDFTPVPVTGTDEISQITESYNTLKVNTKEYIDQNEKINSELKVAADIQKGVIPGESCEEDWFNVHASMKTAQNVGGDLYNYFCIGDKYYFVVADVSGKGISAALFMVFINSLIEMIADGNIEPSEILKKVNEKACRGNPQSLFATLFMFVVDKKTGRIECCNAGHNHPYIIGDGKATELITSKNVAVGLFDDEEYTFDTIRLNPGQQMFIFTDGVNEAVNKDKEFFGNDRLEVLLAEESKDPDNLVSNVNKALVEFADGAPQHDDITMMHIAVKDTWDLNIKADKSELKYLRDLIMNNPFIGERTKRLIYLAVEELFVNIYSYAYKGEVETVDQWAHIVMTIKNDELTLIFEDGGKPFDPFKDIQNPDDYDPDEQIGGLGRLMVIRVMDSVSYEYKDKKNITTLKKKLD